MSTLLCKGGWVFQPAMIKKADKNVRSPLQMDLRFKRLAVPHRSPIAI